MQTSVDKKNINKSEAAAGALSQQNGKSAAVQLVDNRPQALVQKKQVEALSVKAVSDAPIQKKANNTGLPDNLKSGIENLSGHSMDDVKVHYNSSQPAQLNAHAYAQGTDIHVASGQEKHLPHEAWHVVQQKQGRVKPTMQMKSKVNINDDEGLEKEADVMGEKALGTVQLRGNLMTSTVAGPAQLVIQAKFVQLPEERILAIQEAAKANGENLDAEYLQGLYVRDADLQNDNPELFFKVMRVPDAYFTGSRDNLDKKTFIFALADAVSKAEDREKELSTEPDEADRLNMMQVLGYETRYWDTNERGPYTAAQIGANAQAIVGGRELERQQNQIISNVLLGGVEEDNGGGYGTIEFRFKKAKGKLYLLNGYQEEAEYYQQKYPDLTIFFRSEQAIRDIGIAYLAADLPYGDERVSNDYVFIEESLDRAFSIAFNQYVDDEDIVRRNYAPDVARASGGPALPPGPLNLPKTREKEYVRRAPRGSRDAGQKAAMSGFSARDYVARFSPEEAAATDWEWLHVQGSRLGGPNRPENLVAGTADSNTHMIPYERAIFELSSVATNLKPVNVKWSATVRKDADGNDTQIGKTISIAIEFPNGMPDAKDNIDPALIAALFPISFNVSDGSVFTKRDRDLIDNIKKPVPADEIVEEENTV